MAYSDYGAYVWKNGENITDECCDISCKIINKEFVFENWYENLINSVTTEFEEETSTISGHAVINLGKFCIVFYKTYNPIIYYLDGSHKETKVLEKGYDSKKDKLHIRGYNLGYQTGFFFYEVDYKEDKYCVIVGSCIGKGWDYTPASKYVLKHLVLFERRDGEIFYKIDTKRDIDWDIVFNKLDRLHDISYERHWRNDYIKSLLKDLITFRFKNISWDLEQILERNENIKWLK